MIPIDIIVYFTSIVYNDLVFEHCYKKIYSKILNEQIYNYTNRTYRVKYGTIFLLRKNLKSINSYR